MKKKATVHIPSSACAVLIPQNAMIEAIRTVAFFFILFFVLLLYDLQSYDFSAR